MLRLCWLLSLMFVLAVSLSGKANGATLAVSVGWNKPPYVIEENDTGFEIELIRAIFNKMGYRLNFIYVPFARSHYLLEKGKIDVAMTLSPRMKISAEQLSESYINYHNAVITLKGRGFSFTSIDDLASISFVGFQNASIVLGERYAKVTTRSPFYLELPDQTHQVEMLLKGRVDAVVMDVNIFNYISRSVMQQAHIDNVDIHPLFATSHYHLGFKDIALKAQFNRALIDFKTTLAYQALINKYDFYQTALPDQK
ncbi:substrate-binding periplasmic protein [Pseudoalteromonas ulvae]|uniref:Amino acid ABC transporter substrate-binding protein n=1 Tax=Pseudoalteromonas ulvae TaxID=107327 RepID=A0A244CPP9_PSEDV|nr:transporter substrate-binding domain-containing protein [Pseudoalteromonas ulvae]OUL57597.1 amino acid ABC transporter substrate-binding protein [Pseudoalteromonas ulvae]